MDLLNALAQFIVDAPGAKRRGGRLCCYSAVVQVFRTGEPFEECEAFQSWGGRVPITPCRNRFTNCLIASHSAHADSFNGQAAVPIVSVGCLHRSCCTCKPTIAPRVQNLLVDDDH